MLYEYELDIEFNWDELVAAAADEGIYSLTGGVCPTHHFSQMPVKGDFVQFEFDTEELTFLVTGTVAAIAHMPIAKSEATLDSEGGVTFVYLKNLLVSRDKTSGQALSDYIHQVVANADFPEED